MSSIMGDVGNASAAMPSCLSSFTSLASSTRHLKSTEGSTAAGRKKRGTCVCPICNESIVEGIKNKKGQDAIFCEGVCVTWLHHQCAGLSQLAFVELQNSTESFHCPHCQLKMYKLEINNLWQTVESLQASVEHLEGCSLVHSVEPVSNVSASNVPLFSLQNSQLISH